MDRLIIVAAVIALIIAALLGYAALRGVTWQTRPAPRPAPQRSSNRDRPAAEAIAATPRFMAKVAVSYIAILIAIGGAGLLGYQFVAWHQSGYWPAPSLADTVSDLSGGAWPSPGARAMLDWIPLGALLLMVSLLCLIIVFRDPPPGESP